MDETIIYVDGSFTVKEGLKCAGCGFYSDKFKGAKALIGNVTNQVAELFGMIKALEYCKKNKINNVVIYTDSMYVCKTATIWMHEWKENNWKTKSNKDIANYDLILKLYKLYNKIKPKIYHMFAHKKEPKNKNSIDWRNWYGNNEADKLAKSGMLKSCQIQINANINYSKITVYKM